MHRLQLRATLAIMSRALPHQSALRGVFVASATAITSAKALKTVEMAIFLRSPYQFAVQAQIVQRSITTRT